MYSTLAESAANFLIFCEKGIFFKFPFRENVYSGPQIRGKVVSEKSFGTSGFRENGHSGRWIRNSAFGKVTLNRKLGYSRGLFRGVALRVAIRATSG